MKFFSARETPTQNITFVALMAGFDAILCLIGAFLPLSSVFLMLLVPLVSAAVALFCKGRYIPIYVIGAIGVSLALSAWNIMNTVFYLIPGLLVGVAYGFLWKLKMPTSINVFATTLLAFGLFYASIYLMKLLFDGVDMINVLLTFIGRGNDPISRQIFPLFAFCYSLGQIIITHIFVTYELQRMGIEDIEGGKLVPYYPLIGAAFLGLGLGVGFAYVPLAYFFLGLGIYWAACAGMDVYPRIHPITFVFLALTIGGSILAFASLYSKMPQSAGLLLLAVPFSGICLCSAVNRLLLYLRDKRGPKPRHYE